MSDDDRWYERERYDPRWDDARRREAERRAATHDHPARRFSSPGVTRSSGPPDYLADDAGLTPDIQDRDPTSRGYHDPQPRLAGREAYGDYARRWGGYGAGGGYTPEPEEGLGHERRSFRQ